MKVLLEARLGGEWRPIRIAHQFSSIRAALDVLPLFAKQQKVCVDDVRVKVLRTEGELLTAKDAVTAYYLELRHS